MSKRTTRKAEIVSKANKGLMEIQNLEISPNPRGVCWYDFALVAPTVGAGVIESIGKLRLYEVQADC